MSEPTLGTLTTKIDLIYDEVHYLRTRLDGLIWKVIGIGATTGGISGLLGFLLGQKML